MFSGIGFCQIFPGLPKYPVLHWIFFYICTAFSLKALKSSYFDSFSKSISNHQKATTLHKTSLHSQGDIHKLCNAQGVRDLLPQWEIGWTKFREVFLSNFVSELFLKVNTLTKKKPQHETPCYLPDFRYGPSKSKLWRNGYLFLVVKGSTLEANISTRVQILFSIYILIRKVF